MDKKKCGRCKEILPVTCFHKASRESSGLQQWCKDCRKTHKKSERLEYFRKFYKENPEKYLEHTYKRKYGISLLEYEKMLSQQDGVCFLCQDKCSSGRRLSVDHSHSTGKVRKLLCGNCNKGLGCFKDNSELLSKAITYLEQFK